MRYQTLRDLEAPHVLHNAASRRSTPAGDVILLASGPDDNSLSMAQNAAHMMERLGLRRHALLLVDSIETCERVGERIVGADGCFWSSRVMGVRPSDSISMQRYWDWRFRLYWPKKHYMAELIRLGFSVLQIDTDVVWVHDPFPLLHAISRGVNATLIAQGDNPFANAGILYARPGRQSQLILDELTWRIGLFQNHPSVVPRLVPFAKPPFYSNSDDQTLFNDIILSAALGNRSWLGSTARMEASSRHNGKAMPTWQSLPEAPRHNQQIGLVRRLSAASHSRVLLGAGEAPWLRSGAQKLWINYIPVGALSTAADGGAAADAALQELEQALVGASAAANRPQHYGPLANLVRDARRAESVAIAPLGLFGHVKVGTASELVGTAVLHLSAKTGFRMKKGYLTSRNLWWPGSQMPAKPPPPANGTADADADAAAVAAAAARRIERDAAERDAALAFFNQSFLTLEAPTPGSLAAWHGGVGGASRAKGGGQGRAGGARAGGAGKGGGGKGGGGGGGGGGKGGVKGKGAGGKVKSAAANRAGALVAQLGLGKL